MGNWSRHPAWLALPAVLVLGLVFSYPVGAFLLRSVTEEAHPAAAFERFVGEPAYVQVLLNTFRTSGIVTVVCLALGYPYAVLMASGGRMARQVLLIVLLLPMWTSMLVRTYSWLVILDRRGPINEGLRALGLIDRPLELVHNQIGVVIGMVQILLPMMVLPLFAVLQQIDMRLSRAAESLGASPARAFIDVYMPMSAPGVFAGSVLVFVTALGFYVTPAILGGPRDTMLGELIATHVGTLLDWSLAAAMGVVLLALTVVLFVLLSRLIRLERIWGA